MARLVYDKHIRHDYQVSNFTDLYNSALYLSILGRPAGRDGVDATASGLLPSPEAADLGDAISDDYPLSFLATGERDNS